MTSRSKKSARASARVAELERSVHGLLRKAEEHEAALAAECAAHAATRREVAALLQLLTLFQGLIDALPNIVFGKDREWRYAVINKAFMDFFQASHEDLLGKTDYDIFPNEMAGSVRAYDRGVLDRGVPVGHDEVVPGVGEDRTFHTIKFPIRDEDGVLVGLGGVATDITERRRMEAERGALEAQVIEAQRAALRELSTPLIPLSSSVVLLPLIGTIDAQRARQAMETLLHGIGQRRARVAILDITGVRDIDTEVANALLQSAEGARLLGAEVVLTGIQPRIAQILVELGIDLSAIVTLGTLEAGIAYAMRGARRAP